MVRYVELSARDWAFGLAFLAAFVAALMLGTFFFVIPGWPMGLVAWIAAVFLTILALVQWNTKALGYRCTRCRHEFQISMLTNIVSPHGIGWHGAWKWLRCPRCGKRSLAHVIKKV